MRAKVSTNKLVQEETIRDGGLFRRPEMRTRVKYLVAVFVEFTEEERAVINKHELWEIPIWSSEESPSEYYQNLLEKKGLPRSTETDTITTTIKNLVDPIGTGRSFDSPIDALNFESQVKTKYLPSVKSLMLACETSFGKPQILEF